MPTNDSTLPSVLQKLIDTKTLKYTILLCGSSQQMMQGLVLDAAEPLYGRADTIMRLAPIKVRFLQEVLHTDAVSTIEEYAIWGGVPRYWELRERERSMMEAVKYHVLDVNGTLYEEPVRLFMDDMSQTTMSSTLLSLIGNGVNRLSEIAGSKSFTHRLGQVGDGMQDDRGQFVGVRWSTMDNPLSSCREWQLDRWHSLECSQPMVGKRLT